MKVHYRLIINEEPKNCHPYTYRYGPTSGIELSVREQAVLLEFNMTVSKQFDDIVSMKVQLIPDAMRKAYLIHALKQDTGLAIEKITVFIGDESRTYSKSKDSPHFPFVFSMISCENLNLGSAWNNLDMLSEIFHIVKTDADKDYRFAALYSYLSSIGRPYEIDKFSCLWTSMNALYNNIAKLYMAEVEKNHPIQKVDKILGNDSGSIGALMNILGCGKSKPKGRLMPHAKQEISQLTTKRCSGSLCQDMSAQWFLLTALGLKTVFWKCAMRMDPEQPSMTELCISLPEEITMSLKTAAAASGMQSPGRLRWNGSQSTRMVSLSMRGMN